MEKGLGQGTKSSLVEIRDREKYAFKMDQAYPSSPDPSEALLTITSQKS